MTDQLTLVPRTRPLTDRQKFALDMIEKHQPITSEQLGAFWCQARGRHSADSTCAWDGSTGQELGAALRKRGLVINRRSYGGWCTSDYKPGRTDDSVLQGPSSTTDEHGFPEGF